LQCCANVIYLPCKLTVPTPAFCNVAPNITNSDKLSMKPSKTPVRRQVTKQKDGGVMKKEPVNTANTVESDNRQNHNS